MRMKTCVSALACLALLPTATMFAQEFRGAILGRISDTSGVVVPGATIKVTNEETNVGIETKSNAKGNYTASLKRGSLRVASTPGRT